MIDPKAAVDAVLGCVAGRLDPAACHVCTTAGPPALDHCCDDTLDDGSPCSGQVTAHLAGVVPVDQQLRRSNPTVAPCRPGPLAAEVVVTVARCHPTLDDAGRAPPCSQLAAAADQVSADVAALWAGMTCCGQRVVVQSVDVAQPPQGGCIVVVARLLVAIDG